MSNLYSGRLQVVAAVLKRRFPNLTVTEVITLATDIVDALFPEPK